MISRYIADARKDDDVVARRWAVGQSAENGFFSNSKSEPTIGQPLVDHGGWCIECYSNWDFRKDVRVSYSSSSITSFYLAISKAISLLQASAHVLVNASMFSGFCLE